MAKFKKGDVVQLISGGPPMTVKDVSDTGEFSFEGTGDNNTHCIWFEGTEKKDDFFDDITLQLYVKPTVQHDYDPYKEEE
jgi:uncharacterized protein YodC (DUF2158 family)